MNSFWIISCIACTSCFYIRDVVRFRWAFVRRISFEIVS